MFAKTPVYGSRWIPKNVEHLWRLTDFGGSKIRP